MKKIYVLDTNVLIQAPHALKCFEDNEVVLPLVVLEELDAHKRDEGERGANVDHRGGRGHITCRGEEAGSRPRPGCRWPPWSAYPCGAP